jgi:hypothetical protein
MKPGNDFSCRASHIAGHFFPEERPDETADARPRFFG